MITSDQIKEKLEKFLNRKPTDNEVSNGFKDYNIIQEIILDKIEEQNKTILDLQNQLKAIKK